MDDLYELLIEAITDAWSLSADQIVIGAIRAERDRPWVAITCSGVTIHSAPGGKDHVVDQLMVTYSGPPSGGTGDRAKLAMANALISAMASGDLAAYNLISPHVGMLEDTEEPDDSAIVFSITWDQISFRVCAG